MYNVCATFNFSDIFDISSRLGRYEDSRLAIERCLFELNVMEHRHHQDSRTDEWLVSGISIRQTEDGFVRYVDEIVKTYLRLPLS